MASWNGTCANTTALTIAQPPFLIDTYHGRACVVSSNLTTSPTTPISILSADSSSGGSSIFQTCCGIDSAVSSFVEKTRDGQNCGFTYCNVPDEAAAKGFMACLNATATGVRAECFLSTAMAPDEPSTAHHSGSSGRRIDRLLMVSMGVLAILALGIGGSALE
ncbi:hypothetical protein GLAREA_02938 [Glarea lozoyensis ATCC 20868]|uniref:Uncharacterized protein n=1 Tax=Glarea lozoyensis (strain ATCC 20868 / MF5171) TaxID=1116229 RepID=S3CPD9_GLAL2|nr:uncharacterized protein GLAREA_02938 [Glarea lozoyensis ATCC 20868]EPE27024.1 hypothetical protein GLAREA_02938 [Glarea lozoyensis ATCC 20868]